MCIFINFLKIPHIFLALNSFSPVKKLGFFFQKMIYWKIRVRGGKETDQSSRM